MKDKALSVLFALLLMLSLSACGQREAPPAESAVPSFAPETEEIPIVSPTPEPTPEPSPSPEPMPEPVMLAIDPKELPESLGEFLCRFNEGYSDRANGREYDSENAVDVRANLLSQIVCGYPCVDFALYPVSAPVFHWGDGTSDPMNWAGDAGYYAEFDPAAVQWIAQQVFHLSDADYQAVLDRCLFSGAFYQGQNAAGEERFFLSVRSTGAQGSLVHVESAQTDGEHYEIVYDYLLWPNDYLGSYAATLELRENAGQPYWSLYRQTAQLPLDEPEDAPELFAQLGETFVLSNGVDSWWTELTIAEDGSFTGSYLDNDLEENGDDYDQTIYYADFEGRFANPRRINAYTYSVELLDLSYLDYTPDYIVEEDDGWRVLYRYADAVGLEGSSTFYFYAPGAPVYKLPDSFVNWYACSKPLGDYDLELPGWGLMNRAEGQGFAS